MIFKLVYLKTNFKTDLDSFLFIYTEYKKVQDLFYLKLMFPV